MRQKVSTKTYIASLLATFIIFTGALIVSAYINNRKISELRIAEDKAATNILSLETQYDLFNNTSCATFDDTPLRAELSELDSRLTFMEQQLGNNNPDVFNLKRYYSLLEIKDYLLTKKMAAECKRPVVLILYFYKTSGCDACITQQYYLRAVQQKYPSIKLYSFDYDLDLPAVQTLISLHTVPKSPPVLDIQGKIYGGFSSLEELEAAITPFISTSTAATNP